MEWCALNARCHSSPHPRRHTSTSEPAPLSSTPSDARTCNSQMHQYVLLLVERLRMTVGELVMAYACVERVSVLHPTTMRVNSIRPMLLGACVIASKTSRDGDLGLRQVAHLSRSLRPPTCAPPDHPPAAPPQLCAAPEIRHTLRRATLPPAVPKRTKRNSRHRHGLARPHRAPDARGAALELLTQS